MKNRHILALLLMFSAMTADAQKTLFVDYIKGLKEIVWNNLRVTGIEVDSTLPSATHQKIPTAKAVKDYVTAHGGGVADGDKGDIVISSSGAVYTVDNGAIDSLKIAQRSISMRDIAQEGATNGQIMKWNGNMWLPSADGGSVPSLTNGHIFVGNGSNVATDVAVTGDISISNTGVVQVNTAKQYFGIVDGYSDASGSQQNNMSLNGSRIVLSPTASFDVTGINTGTNTGKLLFLTNSSSSFNVTFKEDNASSSAANRFKNGADYVLAPNKSVALVHNGTFWRVLSDPTNNSGDVTLSGQNYLSISGQVITVNAVDLSGANVSGTLAPARMGALTGDVTSSAGSYGTTIANNAVNSAKIADGSVGLSDLANMATSSLYYRKTAGNGAPEVNTLATLKTDLGLTGTNSGDQTISLTGDVTGSGNGSFAATIANGAVNSAKIADGSVGLSDLANMATSSLYYRKTAGSGAPEVNTLATLKTDLGLTGTNSGDQTIVLTGDVTGSGNGSFAATIADNSVDGTDIALGSDAQGDVMFYNGTDWVRLPPGTNGQFLQTLGPNANPAWANGAGGSDNWGAQVVEHDATLSGNGITGNLLGLADNAVTNAKMADNAIGSAEIADGSVGLSDLANMATSSLYYRKTAGSGAPEVNTLATLKTDLGLTGTNSGDQTIVLTGDVTGSGNGSFAATIANGAVNSAKIADGSVGLSDLANISTGSLIGRSSAGSGAPEVIAPGSGISITGGQVVNTGDTDASDDATLNGTQTLTNKTLTSPTINTPTLTVNDNVFTVQDNTDNTKKVKLELSGISPLTTQTLTAPNATGTIALTNDQVGGDGSGTLGALTVTKLQNRSVSSSAPSNNHVLKWNGSAWAPAADATGSSLYTGSGTIPDGTIATISDDGTGRFNWFNGNSVWAINDASGQSLLYNMSNQLALDINSSNTALKFGSGGNGLTIDASKIVLSDLPVGVRGNPSAGASFEVGGTSGFIVPPSMTTSQRDAVNGGSAPFGWVYNSTTGTHQFKNSTGWVDVGSGGGGGGGNVIAVDSIWNAKGDLVAATGNNAAVRIPVGPDGAQLYTDPATSTGLRWGPVTISPSQITSDQDNYSPTDWGKAEIVRISGDNGIRAITGFAATWDGNKKTIINVGSYPICFPPEHPDATASNRFTGIGNDYFLLPGADVEIRYDGTSSRWRILGANKSARCERALVYEFQAGSNTASDLGEVQLSAFSSGIFTGVASTTSLPAALGLSTSTSSTAWVLVYASKTSITFSSFGAAALSYRTLVSIPTLSDNTESFAAHVQITSLPSNSAEIPNNTLDVGYTHDSNSGKFLFTSKDNAGATTTLDSGISVTAGKLYQIGIEMDKSRTEARFFIDGVYIGRITTNLPSAVTCGTRNGILKRSGTTARLFHCHNFLAQALYP